MTNLLLECLVGDILAELRSLEGDLVLAYPRRCIGGLFQIHISGYGDQNTTTIGHQLTCGILGHPRMEDQGVRWNVV